MQARYLQIKKKSSSMKFFAWKYSILFTVLISISFFSGVTPAAEDNPMPPLQETVEEILAILRSHSDSEWVTTREKISVIIHKRFDFEEQSRLVLANSWKERSSGEKEHFISLFSTLQEHAYLNRLKEYSGETVQFTKQITKEEKALVFSVIIKDQEEIPIVYRMRRKEAKWLVYDVIIDGVSLVKNYRKQFASILEKETYAGLIREMEEKIKKITAEDEKHNTE